MKNPTDKTECDFVDADIADHCRGRYESGMRMAIERDENIPPGLPTQMQIAKNLKWVYEAINRLEEKLNKL